MIFDNTKNDKYYKLIFNNNAISGSRIWDFLFILFKMSLYKENIIPTYDNILKEFAKIGCTKIKQDTIGTATDTMFRYKLITKEKKLMDHSNLSKNVYLLTPLGKDLGMRIYSMCKIINQIQDEEIVEDKIVENKIINDKIIEEKTI